MWDTPENLSKAPRVIVPLIMALFKPRTVGDWGCHRGYWLQAFRRQGVSELQGFDGRSYDDQFVIPEQCFQTVDFEVSIPSYACDLAVSLETAEHIEEARADEFVQALTESAPLVLFSAAVPGQGGDGHVNEQPHSYWHKKFAAHGFIVLDVIRPCLANESDDSVFPWYRNNLFIYKAVT